MNKLKNICIFLFSDIFEKFFACWFFAGAGIMLFSKGNIQLDNTDISKSILLFTLSFALLSLAEQIQKGFRYLALPVSVLFFGLILLYYNSSIYTFFAIAVIYALSVHHYISNRKPLCTKFSKKHAVIFAAVCTVFFCGCVTAISVYRYLTYSAPNFDFGIFCNMYYNMRESFAPLVSCERDRILSHFAVHFSPALYVFLPVYFIFPSPVTVAVCQTVAIYSGIIPFLLIMKNRNISPKIMCALSVMYLGNAAFGGGCLYDFHENCLLVPFLMWMFYFYDKKKFPAMLVFALLTLMVKEDAFVYVAVFAVYTIIADKQYIKGTGLLLFAGIYFIGACYYINNFGMGIMSDRFSSMINGDEGLLGMVKTVLFNPQYSVKQIFLTKDPSPEKLFYFLQIFAPLAFIPFFTKKKARLILVLPVLLNLFTSYVYQYNISFQYSFGITTLLMYLSVMNVQDMPEKTRNFTSVTAAGLAAMLFFMIIVPAAADDYNSYISNKEMYEEMNEVLSSIPDDASVCASTFLIPHLSERDIIYESYYTTHDDFEYLIFDMRGSYAEDSIRLAVKFEEKGFVPYDLSSEYIHIYKKAQ